jgi:peptide/nickel transport system substrate-binding protein
VETAILPKHILGSVPKDQIANNQFGQNPVGTGAFKFKEWVRGSHITLVRNENYFKAGLPYLDQIVISIIPDITTATDAYQKGEADYIWNGLEAESYDFIARLPNTRANFIDYGLTDQIGFNFLRPYLGDVRVRQAIAYSIDRQDIVSRATLQAGEVSNLLLPKLIATPGPNLTIYDYNPEKAKQILDGAGYMPGPDGIRFSFELIYRRGSPDEINTAELMRDQLKKVGIDMKLKLVDWSTLLDLVYKRQNFDAFIHKQTEFFKAPVVFRARLSSSTIGAGLYPSNVFNYTNKQVDNLLSQAFTEFDEAKRKVTYDRINAIISRDLPMIPLYYYKNLVVARDDFKGDFVPARIYPDHYPLELGWWTKGQLTQTEMKTNVTQGGISSVTIGAFIGIMIVAAVIAVLVRRRVSSRKT